LLGFTSSVTLEDIDATGEFVGPGYGIPSPAGLEAIRVLGSTEGILLDPVYTGKAFSALLAHCREGRFGADETVVFLHTGGLPAIFAYNEVLAEAYGDHPDAHDPVHQYTSK
jgi:1-aminocyclopropane-1-carboxylate deaminase/D-cysteine desulfhydrase-like pyridoxal-dependent ACC family enzyme